MTPQEKMYAFIAQKREDLRKFLVPNKQTLSDFIKDDSRKEFQNKYRNIIKERNGKKIEFSILSGGKIGRNILRNMAKAEIKRNKGELISPLGKMRSRQERKAMAKSLKINFTPHYNGPTFKRERVIGEDGVEYYNIVEVG